MRSMICSSTWQCVGPGDRFTSLVVAFYFVTLPSKILHNSNLMKFSMGIHTEIVSVIPLNFDLETLRLANAEQRIAFG